VGLPGSCTLLGCYLGAGAQLREFAGPWTTPADRLIAVVWAFTPQAQNIFAQTATGSEKSRLIACWQASNDYLRDLSPGIPVVLADGYNESPVMAGDHHERPDVFLYKPFSIKDLADVIQQILA
jgi:hypothetical protein